MLLKQVMVSLLSSISVDDHIVATFAKCSVVTNSTHIMNVYLRLKSVSQLTGSEVLSFKKKLENFKWKTRIFLQSSNESIFINTETNLEHLEKESVSMWQYVNGLALQSTLRQEMTSHNVEMTDVVKNDVCLDVIVNGLVVNQTLFLQTVTCMEFLEHDKLLPRNDIVQTIITYTGCSISAISLLISIIISRKFSLTNSIPGNNFENMCVALGLSNALFVIGIAANDYQTLCYILGTLLHYLWLVAFAFMSISVVHMCNTLTQTVAHTHGDNGSVFKSKCLFTCLGLFLPIMFVFPSVLLDFFRVPYFAAKYSGSVCFPTGYMSNLIFVSGPITLSIVLNTIALIRIMIHVTGNSITMSHVRKSNSFKEGQVYLRICVISGIFWIMGILGACFQSTIIDYIFIVLCSLQGLCVFVAQMTTRLIRKEMRAYRRPKLSYPST